MSLRKIIFALFLLSGFCSLLYQVIWVRLAFSHFGIITPVLSVVLSVFMLGLAVGSWASGAWISRTSRKRGFSAIYAYAATEFLIGVGAFVVPTLFVLGGQMLLPGGEMNSLSYLLFSALIIALALLPWCVAMGATFPFMMAFLKEQKNSSASSFSFLYLANVIGAMCGVVLTADVLVELLGFKRTLWLAGFLNFLIAAVSVGLGVRWGRSKRANAALHLDRPHASVSAKEAWWMGGILFITGFTSMSLEVVWVRDFTPVLGTTVYAFALIVAVYLLATWLGSSFYRRHLDTRQVMSVPNLLAALAVFCLFPIVVNDPRMHSGPAGVVLGIFPFSFLLGYLTPSLIDGYSQGDPDRAGKAYAINIFGCILGPLFASYLFLPSLGVKNSMILMALPYVALFVAHVTATPERWRFSAGAATAVLLAGAIWVNRTYEEAYSQCVIRRDATATVVSLGSGAGKMLLVNGVGITSLTTITKVMAHLPLMLLKEKPHAALNICFGMGTTYRSLLRWEGLQVTAVELVPSVKAAFGYYHDDAADLLNDPRGRVVIDDGRRFLSRTDQMFDVITIDPPPPIEAAGSSLLYAKEFYALIKKRLQPSGILQQWYPGGPGVECQAVTRSLTESFPYVKVFTSMEGWGIHFLASMKPIPARTAEQCYARLPEAARKDLLEWQPGVKALDFIKRSLAREIPVSLLLSVDDSRAISDDRPYNEYYLLRRSWAHYRRQWEGLWRT